MVGVEEEMPVAALLQEAPALLRLNLQLRQTIWTDLPFNQKLTHLELHNAHNTDFSPNTQGFLSSLRQMPHLQMLGLYSALPGVDEYGALPLSLPGLQRLSLTDHTCDIGYFFQILRVPNLATVHLVFSDFEEEEDIADEIYDALQDLQISIGYHPEPRRTVSTVRVWDTSLELCFTPDPQSECSLSNLIISDCSATSNDGQPPVNIHDHLESFKPLFEFATVNALEVEEQNPKAIPEEAWTFLGSLPNLRVVTFNATPLGAFLDTLETKPKPFLETIPRLLTSQPFRPFDLCPWNSMKKTTKWTWRNLPLVSSRS
ncbi:hypothetical protein FA13DRAFT_1786137 [Coprinellus micaceus]|uniref:F-box domain-containing protein n=1 Tax=Coprinellus micaceus TaxID=71717 RepID=A0A4Y7TW05_COPMI|nr:hypothetical protein FA13DRAFT_1786137 [Coprinellus micaceus]